MAYEQVCKECNGGKETWIHYDIVWSNSVFTCKCGRKYAAVIPLPPKIGEKYRPVYWRKLGWFERVTNFIFG